MNKYNPSEHHRRSIRLPEYDYSQSGMYFITICTYQKQCLFGEINQGQMYLNQIGKMVAQEWLNSAKIRQEITLDEWIIMPNHIHGIVIIEKETDFNQGINHQKGASLAPLQGGRKPRSLSSFVGGFKSAVTKRIKAISTEPNPPVWQRNFYESIIRNEQKLWQIREYILNNPYRWQQDPEKLQHQKQELLIDLIM
ncbi:MAG: transposase [Gloeocapsa sp. DLM2.Bin57]|mgnify:CR=1 FL=1|nr:MAG: transposase [Gloeocapsa sp. DLM2.Bin57]